MPQITFPSEWLKMNDNVQQGDVIQFLNVGVINDDGQHVFDVAVFRAGELIEPEKKFGLNKGNFKAISALYGSNSDLWVNKEMTVNSVKKQNPKTGLLVDSIALSPVLPPSMPTAPVAEPDVPFEGGGTNL